MSPKADTNISEQVEAAILGFSSPIFTASDLVGSLGVNRKAIDQVLLRGVERGWLERMERGVYRRSDGTSVLEERSLRESEQEPVPPVISGDLPKIANLIWTTADEVLRGDYKPHEYGSVILPFTVMRRIDCVLEPTKAKVLEAAVKRAKSDVDPAFFFEKATGGLKFWNTSKFDFAALANDSAGIKKNMLDYVGGFSESIRDIFDYYKTIDLINDLARKNLLFLLVQKFAKVNLHPDVVSNADMGQAFEELIRRFSEQSNETAGEHYTPRDAIRLAVELLFATDEDPTLSKDHRIVKLYDPTAGTGGMLSVAEEHLKHLNSTIDVLPYGQELNEQTYAICKADMLIKGQDISKIVLGNTLSNDAFPNEKFDYMLSNPPYGVDWKKVKDEVETEAKKLGFKGRFGPGLPRISDGQMLFLLHLISKMHPKGSGETSRIAIVMNGSPLFSGGAGSGESEIRRFIIEHDLLEAIVALPTEMFYNTGIATYIWILSNNKEKRRAGKIQLVSGTGIYEDLRRGLGSKRRKMNAGNIASVVKAYGAFDDSDISKVLLNDAFGYNTIIVERPLRLAFEITDQRIDALMQEPSLRKNGIDETSLRKALASIGGKRHLSRAAFLVALNSALENAKVVLKAPQYKAVWQAFSERDPEADICLDIKGEVEPDPDLRDTENVPLGEDVESYMAHNVLPFASGAWVDHSKTKPGYEVPFTRYFFQRALPRPLTDIDRDLSAVVKRIGDRISGVA